MKKVINKLEIYFSMNLCDCLGFLWGLLFVPQWSLQRHMEKITHRKPKVALWCLITSKSNTLKQWLHQTFAWFFSNLLEKLTVSHANPNILKTCSHAFENVEMLLTLMSSLTILCREDALLNWSEVYLEFNVIWKSSWSYHKYDIPYSFRMFLSLAIHCDWYLP